MVGIMVKYSDFYKEPIPANHIDLIKLIPKEELLATIAAVNTRLKPIYNSYFDDSRRTQVDCLKAIFLDDKNSNANSNCRDYIKAFLNSPAHYSLFTRVTCLYAFQEILSSNGFAKETPVWNFDLRERIFKFLLIMNEYILAYNDDYNDKDNEELGDSLFEYLMFKELPHNQYYNTSNAINLFYKSWELFQSIQKDHFFGPHLEIYLKNTFGVSDLSEFFKIQISTFFMSHDDKLKINYINLPKDQVDVAKILDKYSTRNNFKLPDRNDLKIFEFLDLKKSPLYKNDFNYGKETTTYLVLDNILFIEKVYSLFINDFWFDYLSKKKICERADWGNFIGSIFFEPFLETILRNCFSNNIRTTLKVTDELKFKIPGENEIEFADFYIREKNRIILAEAKSNYLPQVHGYKTVKNIIDFKALDLAKFYQDYGLEQLAVKTVKRFHEYKKFLNDDPRYLNGKVKIFPVLIVNDPIFSSGYTSFTFRKKFVEILNANNVEIENDFHVIFPLTLINISGLQDIEQSLSDGNENIFNILRYFFSITNVKRIGAEGTFIVLKTIEHAINKRIKSKLIANRIRKLHWLEIDHAI